jgi:hypothetical protein
MRIALALALLPLSALAEEVDVELVLLADTTGSIDGDERRFQRQGYAAAITDPRVVTAIESTLTGRIAVTYVEWAGPDDQVPLVPWTIIDGPESAAAFAAALDPEMPRLAYGPNAIGAAIAAGHRMIDDNAIDGLRRVIDFSGDSANNRDGPPVEPARAAALAAGITINGLAVLCRGCSGPADGSGDLVGRFSREIIGGPGAFVIAADDTTTFADAVRRKLILEIAGETPLPPLASR